MRLIFILFLCFVTSASATVQEPLNGEVSAVYALLDRILPERAALHFQLQINKTACGPSRCFQLKDMDDQVQIIASSASELSAGVGWYLRNLLNQTIGWPRGGGSRMFLPKIWPKIGSTPVVKSRAVPWSYLMNVCTHSYSLAWYDWADWERFIDWMALSGVNLVLALTGQEQVQYEVFRALGVNDTDIRSWFNGPAFLTWSRGQNEYGNSICGPLPRSWMKRQWELQRNHILPLLRSLGITGQLPGFQGNVPVQLKAIYSDANMTEEGDTGWLDALDPLYGRIADMWMKTLVDNFGTDHWYQLDGYFNGGTAPWLASSASHNDAWFRRGLQVYTGLNRTDPKAVWSFQGFSFVGWSTPEQASFLKGFVDSAPKGKFVVIDMSYDTPEWMKWDNASFFGAPFVWSRLHNFGGTDGMKGDLRRINRIPFDALEANTSIFGSGATPEGIDQNPAWYEFLLEQNFREAPVGNLTAHLIRRGHKRYGLVEPNTDISMAWSLLVDSVYSDDMSVQDHTGIAHLQPPGGDSSSLFEKDRYTPKPVMCKLFSAWDHFIRAATWSQGRFYLAEPFIYDLVNLGREILAQMATVSALNFSDATSRDVLDRREILASGKFYVQILHDSDELVATDAAFLLGPWIESARRWGEGSHDCFSAIVGNNGSDSCERFYEWNARTQITTWNPTPKGSASIPGGPIDYACKHWSGLIKDYYARRAVLLLRQALRDQSASVALNQTNVSRLFARHAYKWTTSVKKYPTSTSGDAVEVSLAMYEKYKHWFSSCVGLTGVDGSSMTVA